MATANYTLTELQQLALDRLENNSTFYPTDVLTPIINEAICVSNAMCGWFSTTERVVSQANQLVYDVPSSIVYPQRVQFEGIQLDPTPIDRIGQDYRSWVTDTISTFGGGVARWVPIGITKFAIHPMDSFGGNDIEVTGVAEPTTLVSGSDTMPLEDEWVSMVVDYCAMRAPLPNGGKMFADASMIYTRSFIPSIRKMKQLDRMKWPRYFVLRGAPVVEAQP